jgi:hypothetical protein
MIGPGGLLLVISHLFQVPVLVLWVGLENVNNYTWIRKVILQVDTEFYCRCSKLITNPLECPFIDTDYRTLAGNEQIHN